MASDTARPPSARPCAQRGAIGIIERDGRYLVIRRAEGIPCPGFWCFPGGHVEPGETSRRAVVRELMEELGIRVKPFQRLGTVRVSASNHILAVWRVRHVDGAIRPNESEIAEMAWLTPADIRTHEMGLPSNGHVLDLLGH